MKSDYNTALKILIETSQVFKKSKFSNKVQGKVKTGGQARSFLCWWTTLKLYMNVLKINDL